MTAVQCHAGGDNPALAQKIATKHPCVQGSRQIQGYVEELI